jgi:opacity protein-like surface antigen
MPFGLRLNFAAHTASGVAASQEAIMKVQVLSLVVTFVAVAAAPSMAQEKRTQDPNGYVTGFGGAAWADGNSTGSVLFEGGVRVAPHVTAFGNIGRFANLKGDLQPTLDAATTALSEQGLGVTSGGTLPAWYGVGGLRAAFPASAHLLPYVLGGLGAARLNPSPQLTYASGTLPNGLTPAVGTDVTPTLIALDSFTAPPASNALMFILGGGAEIPTVPHWSVDLGYRYSRIAADSTLSAAALNTNVMTFGFGYRF